VQILPLCYQGHGLRDVGSSIISDHGELVFLIAWSAGEGLNLERFRWYRPNCDSDPRLYQCDVETSLQEGMGLRCVYRPSVLFDVRSDRVRQESIMEWYLMVLRQYADFTGRARRKEYWMFTLVSLIISVVLAILDGMLGLESTVGCSTLACSGSCTRWRCCCPLWPLAPAGYTTSAAVGGGCCSASAFLRLDAAGAGCVH
jgi:hypothetical protein